MTSGAVCFNFDPLTFFWLKFVTDISSGAGPTYLFANNMRWATDILPVFADMKTFILQIKQYRKEIYVYILQM